MTETICPKDRESLGKRSGLLGLLGNLLLAALKAGAGFLSNSVAVTADALNNLGDCVSSLVALLGFSISARGKDRHHPYGHGRMEYVCGFLVSLLILMTGVSVGWDALARLLHPQPVAASVLTAAVLGLGILAKAGMAWYVARLNRRAGSPVLKAMERDSLADAFVTAGTLAGVLLAPFTALPVDGILGLLVSAVILRSGWGSFRENLLLLLGEGADPATEEGILQVLAVYLPENTVEEISLHDYGPGNRLAYIRLAPPPPEEALSFSQALAPVKEALRQELRIGATLYWELPEAGN